MHHPLDDQVSDICSILRVVGPADLMISETASGGVLAWKRDDERSATEISQAIAQRLRELGAGRGTREKRRTKLSILFVDDDRAILNTVLKLLRHDLTAWDVTCANDGAEAIALLQRTRFDVVVSDLMMPGANGMTVLAVARQHNPLGKRILMTGSIVEDHPIDADVVIAKVHMRSELRGALLRRRCPEAC